MPTPSRVFLAPALALATLLGEASLARACPNCATAVVVRASVLDTGFASNLGLVSLPLVVLSAVTMLLYRIGKHE